jgi:hypothetical protein
VEIERNAAFQQLAGMANVCDEIFAGRYPRENPTAQVDLDDYLLRRTYLGPDHPEVPGEVVADGGRFDFQVGAFAVVCLPVAHAQPSGDDQPLPLFHGCLHVLGKAPECGDGEPCGVLVR